MKIETFLLHVALLFSLQIFSWICSDPFGANTIRRTRHISFAQDEFNKGFHAKKFERVQGGKAGELGAFDELNEKSSRIT